MIKPHRDRGAATLLVLSVTGVLMFVGLGLSGVAAIVLTQRSAQAAADLSALAAASAAVAGKDACAAATQIAVANSGILERCAQSGSVVTVAVTVPGPRLAGRDHDVTAEARAGPSGSVTPD